MVEQSPVDRMSFESALEELESIVRDLETGRAPLEESIAAYERGVALRKHCESRLRAAQMKIEMITTDQSGAIRTAPFAES